MSEDGYLPFFQRKTTKPNGQTDEWTLGPSVASVLRWLILAVLLFALLLKGLSPGLVFGVVQRMRFFY